MDKINDIKHVSRYSFVQSVTGFKFNGYSTLKGI